MPKKARPAIMQCVPRCVDPPHAYEIESISEKMPAHRPVSGRCQPGNATLGPRSGARRRGSGPVASGASPFWQAISSPRNWSPHEQLRCRGLLCPDGRRHLRLQRRALAQHSNTIIGYLAAMPVAMAATPYAARMLADKFSTPAAQNPLLFFGLFLVAGIAFGALLRTAINETVGPRISLPDRLAGSVLGAVRIALVAVTMVLIFDRIIPADRQPASQRLAAQADPADGRPEGPQIPAARCHRLHRSAEERPADLTGCANGRRGPRAECPAG